MAEESLKFPDYSDEDVSAGSSGLNKTVLVLTFFVVAAFILTVYYLIFTLIINDESSSSSILVVDDVEFIPLENPTRAIITLRNIGNETVYGPLVEIGVGRILDFGRIDTLLPNESIAYGFPLESKEIEVIVEGLKIYPL